jgi:hypothetical protein
MDVKYSRSDLTIVKRNTLTLADLLAIVVPSAAFFEALASYNQLIPKASWQDGAP